MDKRRDYWQVYELTYQTQEGGTYRRFYTARRKALHALQRAMYDASPGDYIWGSGAIRHHQVPNTKKGMLAWLNAKRNKALTN